MPPKCSTLLDLGQQVSPALRARRSLLLLRPRWARDVDSLKFDLVLACLIEIQVLRFVSLLLVRRMAQPRLFRQGYGPKQSKIAIITRKPSYDMSENVNGNTAGFCLECWCVSAVLVVWGGFLFWSMSFRASQLFGGATWAILALLCPICSCGFLKSARRILNCGLL